jgi:hypothetical protein
MPIIISLAVWIAAALFVVTSATVNVLFLVTLGRTVAEMAVFASVSLSADLAKLALPVLIGRALLDKTRVAAVLGVLLLIPVIVLSIASGAGFAAATRSGVAAERTDTADLIARLEASLGDLARRRASLPTARELAVIEAAIAARVADRRWQSSRQCTDARNPSERRWCAGSLELDVERAAAEARATLDTERDKQQSALMAVRRALGGRHADPQAAALSALLHLEPQTIRAGFALAIAFVLELGSAVLVFLATRQLLGPPAPKPKPEEERKPEPAPEPAAQPVSVPPQADRAFWQRRHVAAKANGAHSNAAEANGHERQ